MTDRLPKNVSPETFALHGAYDPRFSEGSLKPPAFHTSTFVAPTAEDLAQWFVQGYGLDGQPPRAPDGLVYSRVCNPNLQIVEERWSRFERSEASALFASGMAAISTTLLALLRPGDSILYTTPVYGGTDFLMEHVLPAFGIKTHPIPIELSANKILGRWMAFDEGSRPKMIFFESPSNPTLQLGDLQETMHVFRTVPDRPIIAVDATILGPIFMRSIHLGADLVLHSATKSIGGHSDLIAGLVSGKSELIGVIKAMRIILGTMTDPQTAWLISRSLETYKVRVEASHQKAMKVARFLHEHPLVERVFFPGLFCGEEQMHRYSNQCSGNGSLMSFTVAGGQERAYRILNALRVIKLAVSLGGTESLAEHPRTHTHSDVPSGLQDAFGIAPNMIRLSVGLEDADDVIRDLEQAFANI